LRPTCDLSNSKHAEQRRVALVEEPCLRLLSGADSISTLATAAIRHGRSFSVLVRQSLTTCALSRRRSRSASAKTYAFTMGMSWRLASKASEGCPGTPCTLVAKVLRFQEPRRSTVSLPTLPSIQLQILRGSAALPMSTRLPAARAWRPPTCRDSANPPWQ
jgi:hypothetical protein